jgi:hypothetical protein
MDFFTVIVIAVITFVAVIVILKFWFIFKLQRDSKQQPPVAVDADKAKIDALLKYVEAQKQEAEEKGRLTAMKKAEQKEKLENFKRTKDELKDRLKAKFDGRDWIPLSRILSSADKGNVGIYVLYNETKNKYYVGQAKALYSRIKKHFEVEPIAYDFLNGDKIVVKTLSATEIGNDYRIDHIEKTGIELFSADTDGYNKTVGNM